MIFSKKRKNNQHKFYFERNILEEVADYKYLGIDFNKNLSWNVLSLTKFQRKKVREELIDPGHIHVDLGRVHAIDI